MKNYKYNMIDFHLISKINFKLIKQPNGWKKPQIFRYNRFIKRAVFNYKDIKTIKRALKGLITAFVRFDRRYRKMIDRYRRARKISRKSSAVNLLFMSRRLKSRATLSVFLRVQTASGCSTCSRWTCHFAW